MIGSIIELWQNNPTYRILAALVLLYIATRSALNAAFDPRTDTSGRLAWTMALPISLVAGLAVFMDRADLAIALLFASSVAALSLVSGLCAFLSPVKQVPACVGRIGLFLIPLALLAILTGFSGHLSLTHAVVFALQGLFIYYVRTDPSASLKNELAPVLLDDLPATSAKPSWRVTELVLVGLTVLIATYLVNVSSTAASSPLVRFSDSLLAVGVFTPVLLLPMLGTGMVLIHKGRNIVTAHAAVLLAIINLCVILPLVITLCYFQPLLFRINHWLTGSRDAIAAGQAVSSWHLPYPPSFPLATWRVDSVVLLILAVAALPVATNKLPLGRREGMALIMLYALYLITSALIGARY
ncbi:MAG: hypothetical protein IT448_02700 [Phycisphaerales bacterium]|nr:hypothetical protein [Phycisphaerales bacterium]